MSYRMKTNRTTHLTPHEMLTGRPMPSPNIRGSHKGPPLEQLETELRRYMGQLTGIHRLIFNRRKTEFQSWRRSHQGGWSRVTTCTSESSGESGTNKPRREGPYKVTNATPTAIQVEGSATWYHLNHCTKAAQTKARDDREEEPDADTRGADQLPQDQIQSSQEIQQHGDAENGEPVSDPLRVVPDSAGTSTDPEEG